MVMEDQMSDEEREIAHDVTQVINEAASVGLKLTVVTTRPGVAAARAKVDAHKARQSAAAVSRETYTPVQVTPTPTPAQETQAQDDDGPINIPTPTWVRHSVIDAQTLTVPRPSDDDVIRIPQRA